MGIVVLATIQSWVPGDVAWAFSGQVRSGSLQGWLMRIGSPSCLLSEESNSQKAFENHELRLVYKTPVAEHTRQARHVAPKPASSPRGCGSGPLSCCYAEYLASNPSRLAQSCSSSEFPLSSILHLNAFPSIALQGFFLSALYDN